MMVDAPQMVFDIRQALAERLAADDRVDAVVCGDQGRGWPWLRAVATMLDGLRTAAGLDAAPTALIPRNRPIHVAVIVAHVAAGRQTSMIHSAQTPAGITADVMRLAPALLITERADWTPALAKAADAAGTTAILIEDGDPPQVTLAQPSDPLAATPHDPAIGFQLLSSGTTGAPKRIPLSWATLSSAVLDAQSAYAGTDARAAPQIVIQPLSTIAGLSYLLPALAFGQPIVLLERFELDGWLTAVARHSPRRVSIPAAAIRMLLDRGTPAGALAGVEVVAVGGGFLDPDLQRRFEARFGIPVLTAFGATEFAGVVANWSLDLYRQFGAVKLGSAGRASRNVCLRIVDQATGAPQAPGEVGLLEINAQRLGGSWIRTTDLAAIDADGFLFFHGRADGAVNRGGFKIVPETVVAALLAHPAVADAAVVARPDRRLGEVPVAAVELRAGQPTSGEALRAFVRDRLLSYQVPVEVRVLDRLPRTAMFKVALGDLRAMLSTSEGD